MGLATKWTAKKKYAQKSGQRNTFFFLISLFFIISQNACLISSKRLLNCYCTENTEKSLSHSGKMHFSVSGHVTLGVVR